MFGFVCFISFPVISFCYSGACTFDSMVSICTVLTSAHWYVIQPHAVIEISLQSDGSLCNALFMSSSFPDGPPAGPPIMIKVGGGGYVCDSHLIAYLFFLSSFPVLPLFRHGLRVSSCLLALSSCLRIGICSSARAFAFLLLQNPFQSVLGLRVVLSCVLGYLTRYVLVASLRWGSRMGKTLT